MRRSLVTIVSVLTLTLPLTAAAFTSDARRSVFVDKGTTINGVYMAGGGMLELAGTFTDDVIVGGGTVTVSGPINGDLLVAGGTVKVTGEVKGSIRMVGGTLDLNGKVGRNLIMVGGTLFAGTASDVAGEVLLLGGTATVDGHVGRTLDAWTDMLTLNGKIDGHVKVHFPADDGTNDLRFIVGSTAVIGGDLTYYATLDAEIRSGSTIAGKVTKNAPEPMTTEAREAFDRFFTFARLWNLFSLLVVAALIVLVLPKSLRKTAEIMQQRRGAAFGWGLIIFLASPVAFMILPFTLIGIPLMFILGALYVMALYVSQIFLGFAVGVWLMRLMQRGKDWTLGAKSSAALLPTMLGIVALSLIFDFLLGSDMLPAGVTFFAGLFRLLLVIWAFGALLLTKAQSLKDHELS